MKIKLLFLTLAVSLLASCSKHPQTDSLSATATGNSAANAAILPYNNGYMVDINGDGVADFVIFQGTTLYWKPSNAGDLADLLTIVKPSPVVAYGIRPAPSGRASLYVYDSNLTEYLCENLTTLGGKPVFGSIEQTR